MVGGRLRLASWSYLIIRPSQKNGGRHVVSEQNFTKQLAKEEGQYIEIPSK